MTQSAFKHLIVGVTGGIAAYKAAELVRHLTKMGTEVQVVMTQAACRFISPVMLQALSGRPVLTDLWEDHTENGMAHIELSRRTEAILIAPASADFLAKIAHGHADDLLSTLCLARNCQLMVAPAMNVQMWDNPATQRNMELLRNDGVLVFGPDHGNLACGEEGFGRMLEIDLLLEEMEASRQPKLLAGRKILVTAGPTFEAIDPVRGLTNLSSGKMGYAIARSALEMGAAVTLISGRTSEHPPRGVRLMQVESAEQMYESVMANISGQDAFISVAAVADYRAVQPHPEKIKKSESRLVLELESTPDILAAVANLQNAPFCVGFAAESEKLIEHAEQKRRRKKLPLLAANLIQNGFGGNENEIVLLDSNGAHPLPRAPKIELARKILSHMANMLPNRSEG